MEIPEPPIPNCEEWPAFDKLAREKDIVGVYLSGHPLDTFKVQLKQFCTPGGIGNLEDLAAAAAAPSLSGVWSRRPSTR